MWAHLRPQNLRRAEQQPEMTKWPHQLRCNLCGTVIAPHGLNSVCLARAHLKKTHGHASNSRFGLRIVSATGNTCTVLHDMTGSTKRLLVESHQGGHRLVEPDSEGEDTSFDRDDQRVCLEARSGPASAEERGADSNDVLGECCFAQ